MQIFCAHYSTIDLLKVQIKQIRIKELLLIFCIISVSYYDEILGKIKENKSK